jgi:hypothetical protein
VEVLQMGAPLVLSRLESSDIANKCLEPAVAPPQELLAAVSRVPAVLYEAPPQPEKPAPLQGWYAERAKLMGAQYLQTE